MIISDFELSYTPITGVLWINCEEYIGPIYMPLPQLFKLFKLEEIDLENADDEDDFKFYRTKININLEENLLVGCEEDFTFFVRECTVEGLS